MEYAMGALRAMDAFSADGVLLPLVRYYQRPVLTMHQALVAPPQ